MVRNFNPIWLILCQNSSNGICTSIQLVTEGVIMTLGNSGMKILTNVFFQIQPTLRPASDAELFKLEPNLIHWIKYLKSLASERIKNVYFNLEWLTHSSRLAWPGISTLDRLGTALIKMPNFCKQFDRNEHFPPFKLSSAAIKIGVWITSFALSNFGWPSFQLGSPHEKVSVWTGPNFTLPQFGTEH